jgi:type VI secretion system Hcp family effector
MPQKFFVTIEGAKQGKFKGEGAGAGAKHADQIAGLAFHYEVTRPVTAAATGAAMATGKRQHSPVTFVKHWGAASPQLLKALIDNELLKSVVFDFEETTPNGQTKVFYTIKLTDAGVVSVKQDVPPPGSPSAGETIEEIGLTFAKIEETSVTGGTTVTD